MAYLSTNVILAMSNDQEFPEEPKIAVEMSDNEVVASDEENVPPTNAGTKKPGKKRNTTSAPRELSEASKQALEGLAQLGTPEEKIHQALEFMKASLTQSGNPRFKDFWDMRHYCLSLFKENLSTASRAHLWSTYIELSTEARRLKEILDEQSAFASEQIELAIAALEKDLADYDQLVLQMRPVVIEPSSAMKAKSSYYEKIQSELNFLNTLASRINALRKEIIKTDMRMKTKAKFFDKLSTAGDCIFPRRKELVKEISQEFLQDIKHFVEGEFAKGMEKVGQPLYILREEIKILQGVAKVLTLNTQVFKETREMLSACWDKVREGEKKKKEEYAQKRQASQQNAELVKEKITLFAANAQKEDAILGNLHIEAKEIQDFMRNLDLDRESVLSLKAQLKDILQPFTDKEKAEEVARMEKLRQVEQDKKDKILSQLQKTEDLLAALDSIELSEAIETKENLEKEFAELGAAKAEKMRFEKTIRKLSDAIVDKKEKNVLNLPSEDREALGQLRGILHERLQERNEIKKNLEIHRKTLGGSGFDFEKAMAIREVMDNDKERLGKINDSIEELEGKIAEIEG